MTCLTQSIIKEINLYYDLNVMLKCREMSFLLALNVGLFQRSHLLQKPGVNIPVDAQSSRLLWRAT